MPEIDDELREWINQHNPEAQEIAPQAYEDIRQEVLAVCREKLALMMIRCSIATGHGDTFDDLLGELEAELSRWRSAPEL